MQISKSKSSFFILAIGLIIAMAFLALGSAPSVHAQDIETPTPDGQATTESVTATPAAPEPTIVEATATPAANTAADAATPAPTEDMQALIEASPTSDLSAQIVGGSMATPGEYPWLVALIGYNAPADNFYDSYGYQFCGGTLVAPQWVVTAAHCITNNSGGVVSAASINIVAGVYNLRFPTAGYQRRSISQIIRHPQYNNFTTDYDIALLKLSSPVVIGGSGETATALLPLVPASIGDLNGATSWVAGWGDTTGYNTYPYELYKVSVPIISNTLCNDGSHYNGGITANMLCAGDTTLGGKDSCQGDSGGPLIISNAGTWNLAGIVSWGYNCAAAQYPGVYTRVSNFVNWVNGYLYPMPSVPVLSLPANNSLTLNYMPKLDWANTNPLADHYEIQIDSVDANFYPSDIFVDTTNISEYTPASNLTENTKYYWRVRAYNVLGTATNWSKVFSFRAAILPPTLSAPAVNESLLNKRPTFTWNSVSGASSYSIQISLVNTCATASVSGTATGLTFTPIADLQPNKDYYWHVRANTVIGGNGPSAYSECRHFHTANPPSAPTLVSPAANALTFNYTPLLVWGISTLPLPAGSTVFDHYQVQIDDSSAFSDPLVDSHDTTTGNIAEVSYTAPTLTPGVTYYWRVRSFNTSGDYSAWSLTRSLRAAILSPTLNSPTADESLLNKRPTFTWNSVSGASGYAIQISLVNTCATASVSGTATGLTFTPTADLQPNKDYYWLVRATTALTGNGPSVYSECRHFHTANPPSAPTLVSPAANALTFNYTPLLVWGISTLPLPAGSTVFDHYQVQIDDSSAFSDPLVDSHDTTTGNIAEVSYTAPTLNPAITYYWRVRSFNTSGDYSAWSVRALRTPYTVPVLSSPLDNTTTVEARPTFTWSAVSGATSYNIQISRNTIFTSLAVSGTATGTSYTPSVNLPGDVPLYWRARANGAYGPGVWSNYRTLNTINPLGDRDGDSLKNIWEINGYDANGDGVIDVNLPALGANWLHKDIFVEMDYMVRPTGPVDFRPNATVMQGIVDTFANAPVSNPDGTTGINIHLDLSNQVPYAQYLNYPAMSAAAAIKSANFDSKRAAIYHYMIWADQYENAPSTPTTSSGLGYQPGVDFIVTLGGWPTPGGTDNQKIGTFIHELGHNLGLMHGGVDGNNNKPNYLSVMNYTFQTNGIYRNGSGPFFDYQRINTAPINETSLNETLGINSPEANAQNYYTWFSCPDGITWGGGYVNALDWNCDGDTTDTLVSTDTSFDGLKGTLTAQNNWQHILFNGGGIIGSGLAPNDLSALAELLPQPDFQELTWEMQQQMNLPPKP